MTFDHVRAASVAEAVRVLDREGSEAHLLAGGSAFMLLYKQALIRPRVVIGLDRVAELRGIRREIDGGLWIGAMNTHRDIERSPLVRDHCPALARAFASIATIRIRNQATIGGNLAHADPAQDPPPMLMALGADIELTGPQGPRRVPIDEFFVDVLETALAPNEVITGIRLPALAQGTAATYVKFLPRTEADYATVSVAARVRMDGDQRYAEVAVCLGAVGPTPIRAERVEAALIGERPTSKRIASVAALVRDEIDPFDDVRGSASYKRDMAVVHVRRALMSLRAT